jgi:hypothetical protein
MGSVDAVGADTEHLWTLDARKRTVRCNVMSRGATAGLAIRFEVRLPEDIEEPTALAPSPDGGLFVLDAKKGEIFRLGMPGGEILGRMRAPSKTTTDIAVQWKFLWAVDPKRKLVFMLDGEGRVLVMTRGASDLRGIASAPGRVWTLGGEESRIVRFAVDREQKLRIAKRRTANIRCMVLGVGTSYLAVPLDLNRQKVLGPILCAAGATAARDRWGQAVVRFPMMAEKAELSFRAEMFEVRYFVFPEKTGRLSDISGKRRQDYTVDADMLDLGHPRVRAAAKEVLAGVSKKPAGEEAYWIARLSYEYTIRHVPYRRGGSWVSAPKALERGWGTCSPIAFVFVAICRACGLPARFAAGTKYRGRDPSMDREFHRWAEVYLPNYGWVSVDASFSTYKDPNPAPWKVARSFGFIPNNTFILMVGGGDSDIFGWRYNGTGGQVLIEWSKVRQD